ncbi:hypothetical protein ACO0R3_001575 [Hanseniaspora guilliermondii]
MLFNKVIFTSAALLATIKSIQADSQEFGIVTIDSGTALQYSSTLIDTDSSTDGYYPISVGSSYNQPVWEYVVDDQGHLVANGTYYWGIIPNSDGQYGVTTDASKAIKGFSIEDGALASSLGYYFIAVPDGTSWTLYSKNAEGNNGNTKNNLGLALAAYTSSGFASDFTPSNTSNDSVSNSTTSAMKNSTTLAPSLNSSTVVIATSSIAKSQNSSVATTSIASSVAASNHTSANKTSSSSKASSTHSHKNGAEVVRGSLSLLAMGLAGLFL